MYLKEDILGRQTEACRSRGLGPAVLGLLVWWLGEETTRLVQGMWLVACGVPRLLWLHRQACVSFEKE